MAERRKPATLVFCDVTGSTSMGEALDPEAVRDLMFRYFHQMRSAIERHGGTVEKFVGDAVMAVFGVPTAHEDDAIRAVRAAAEMRDRLGTLNEELARRFGRRISLRIGVNTGEVVAGSPDDRGTLVTGDAVNVAARLEQAADADDILIGDATFELVRDAVSVEPVSPIFAKGKSEPLSAYRLITVAPDPIRVGRPELAPWVGRDDELATLDAAFAEASSSASCGLVTVIGEPGVGKSRLAAEFLRTTASEVRVLRARCLSYGEGITYWPLRELVREATGILDEDPPEVARGRIVDVLVDADDRELAAAYLAAAIGLAAGDATEEGIAWASRTLFETLARERPLVVLVDDLHWAEEPIRALIRSVERLAAEPILLLCLARPELLAADPNWPETVRLEPLDADVTRRLVERILEDPAPEDVIAGIADTSGGNALFAEELVAKLRDDGVLERRDGAWVATRDLSAIAMPATLTAVLSDRLDRLDEAERSVLETGSIEGEVFHRGAVAALAPSPPISLVETLQRLSDAALLRAAPSAFADDAAFRFRHILLRDAAYGSLPKGTRAALHERFADWLEGTAERIEEYEEIIGYHLERAFRYRDELWTLDEEAGAIARRAALRLASAGRRAIVKRDHHAATSLLERATNLPEGGATERLALLADLADAVTDAGDLARGTDLHRDVIRRAEAIGDRPTELRARLHLVEPSVHAGDQTPEEALGELTGSLRPACEALGDDRLLGHLWALIGRMQFWLDRAAEAEVAYERAIRHAELAGDRRRRNETLAWLIGAKAHGPTPAGDVIAFCDDVLAAEPDDPIVELFAHEKRGWMLAMQGRFDDARAAIERSREIARIFDLKVRLGMSAFYVASIELLADGDLDLAEATLLEADALLGSIGETAFRSSIALCLARVLARRGRLDEAVAALGRAGDEGFEASGFRAKLIAGRGDPGPGIIARRGEVDRAVDLARRGAETARRSDYLDALGETLVDLADALLLAGHRDEAIAALREAIEAHERKGNVVSAELARRMLTSVTTDEVD